MDDSLCFGDWLKRRRKALDLTQEDLARQIGYSVSAIRKIEANQRRASRHVAKKLAEVLAVPPEEHSTFLRSATHEPAIDDLAALTEKSTPPPALPLSTHCPIPLTSFIGREQEIATLKEVLARNRLLTLTGVGGVGKTRLAIQLVYDIIRGNFEVDGKTPPRLATSTAAGMFQDGVAWVELGALSDPALVPQSVAHTLGLLEAPDRPLTETLANFLRPRHMLLVLDSCEHLVTACARLSAALLHACSTLHMLATSREPLRITGEIVWPVPPLSAPMEDRDLEPGQNTLYDSNLPKVAEPSGDYTCLTQYESVRLFVERAAAVWPSFRLTQHNASAVARVCQRLDGIPLALELAAACIKVLSVEQIARRLDDRFDLLTLGSCTALPRQQTLRATMDWSYDLLSPKEQMLLRRVAVFADWFTLQAAEAVCAGEGLERTELLGLLARLVDKSLVVAQRREGRRYRLLETVRQYAHEKLSLTDELSCVQQRQAEFCLASGEPT